MNAAVIPFVQFIRPDGRRRHVEIVRSDDVAKQARQLILAGCRLEVEELTTGHVSMTVERDDANGETEVLAQRVVMNGPKVPTAVDSMIAEAFRVLFSSNQRVKCATDGCLNGVETRGALCRDCTTS